VYQDIDEPNSFVYEDYFSDAKGRLNTDMPVTTVTMTFTEEDGKTKIVSRGVHKNRESLEQVIAMGIERGITETLDRLEEYVTGQSN
jgi:uncharacterized protein YndB with AHSA1/START domain